MRNRLIPLIIISIIYFEGNAQTCAERFNKAQRLYEQGRIDSVIISLNPCLKSKGLISEVSRSIQINIYRLAANTHILLDNYDSAYYYISKLLARKPHYVLETENQDILRFKAALDTIRAYPKWRIGFGLGANQTLVKLVESFSVLEFSEQIPTKNYITELIDFNDLEIVDVSDILGFQIYSFLEYTFWKKNLSVLVEPGFSKFRFEYNATFEELDNLRFEFLQKMKYFALPLLFKYRILLDRKWSPFFLTGVNNRFLLSANKKIVSTSRPGFNTSNTIIRRETPTTPINSLTNTYNIGIELGAGVSFKGNSTSRLMRNSNFNFDVRFIKGLNNLNNEKNRFLNNDLSDVFLFEFYDVSDDIKIKNVVFSISWTYNLSHKVFD